MSFMKCVVFTFHVWYPLILSFNWKQTTLFIKNQHKEVLVVLKDQGLAQELHARIMLQNIFFMSLYSQGGPESNKEMVYASFY